MHDLGHFRERPVGQPGARDERLEGAPVALMREVASHHVESDFSLSRRLLRIDESEARARVEESPDQPGGSDPVDMDTPARDPDAADERSLPRTGPPARPPARRIQVRHALLGVLAAGRIEEVDLPDLVQELARPGGPLRQTLVLLLPPIADLLDQGGIVRVAFGPELVDERLSGLAIEKLRFADIGLAPARDRLLDDPLEVFETLLAPGQDIDGVFQRHGADAGEPLADLGAQVERLRRELVDEQVPVSTLGPAPCGTFRGLRAAHRGDIALD